MSPFIISFFLGLLAVVSLFFIYLRTKKKRKVNEVIKDKAILKIAVPRHNDKSPIAAEQLFSSLHGIGANKKKSMDHFSLEIAAGSYGIHFITVVDRKYKSFVENQFYAQYPEAQISEIGDYSQSFTKDFKYTVKELGLSKGAFMPIKTFMSFEVDPLAAITSAVSSLSPNNEAFIQIVCRPISDEWHKQGREYVNGKRNKTDSEGKKVNLDSGESEQLAQIERKSTKVGFQFVLRILTKTPDQSASERLANEVEASFGQYKTGLFNSIGKLPALKGVDKFFKKVDDFVRQLIFGQTLSDKLNPIEKYKNRFIDEFEPDIVNIEELASLYHLPNRSVETPNISWAESKKLEYPLDIPTENCRVIGVTDYRGVHVKFGIKPLDRLRHMYLIGKTGMGKSTFIEGLIGEDIYDGNGIAVIDPHGDTINHILESMPAERIKDVVIFDPGDNEHPVGLNLLELKPGENVSLVADGLVSVFKKAFADSWGPRLEYILTNTIITLLACQNVSLLAIPRILTDKNYRKFLLKQVEDPVILKFWNEEFAQMSKTTKDTMENTSSILNKIGRFTTNPLIRNIVGQVKSTLDFEDIMNNKKILLINLSQGKVGEENMALLGGMLITRIYSTTVRRVEIDPTKRVPFYLYVDEFQNFATSTFVKILSEARKFGLGLTITHQFIDQIDESIQNAIFGNIGTIMNFAVGPRDADSLVKEYSPYLTAEDLVNQEKFGLVIKLSVDFKQSKPFTAKTLPPQFPETGLRQAAIDHSRELYSKPRDVMEQKIYKWAAQVYDDKGNLIQQTKESEPVLSQPSVQPAPTPQPVVAKTEKPKAPAPIVAAPKEHVPQAANLPGLQNAINVAEEEVAQPKEQGTKPVEQPKPQAPSSQQQSQPGSDSAKKKHKKKKKDGRQPEQQASNEPVKQQTAKPESQRVESRTQPTEQVENKPNEQKPPQTQPVPKPAEQAKPVETSASAEMSDANYDPLPVAREEITPEPPVE